MSPFGKNSKTVHLTLRLHNHVLVKCCSTSLVSLFIYSPPMQITPLAFSKSRWVIRLSLPTHTNTFTEKTNTKGT